MNPESSIAQRYRNACPLSDTMDRFVLGTDLGASVAAFLSSKSNTPDALLPLMSTSVAIKLQELAGLLISIDFRTPLIGRVCRDWRYRGSHKRRMTKMTT